MKLSQENAMQIVCNINEIINQKVNIIDEQGIIIASTDVSRIGKFHAGAKKIMEDHLPQLIINENGGYEGSLPGINYPLIVGDEIIGIVGITGTDERSLSYAKIVKRMTELLVQELARGEEKEAAENVKNHFLHEWLMGDARVITKNFIERGLSIGIDIRVPRRFLAMEVYEDSDTVLVENLRRLESAKRYLQQIAAYRAHHFVMSTPSLMIAGVPMMQDDDIRKIAESYMQAVTSRFHVGIAIGIDNAQGGGDYLLAYQACSHAKKALNSCRHARRNGIRFYDNLDMEIFSDELSELVKWEYIRKIFQGMSDEEIFKAVQLLEIYYNADGSISRAADQLYIHKNTMQNRLLQLKTRTGHDPRSLRDSALFMNALHFYRELM